MSSAEDDRFIQLMQRVQEGSEDAARELLDQYGNHVYRAIRRRLTRPLRAKFDSDDFYQAVWKSFFANRNAITRFRTPEELTAFLGSVAGNKVIDECRRRLMTEKFNVNREKSIDDAVAPAMGSLPSSEPTPSQVAIANEQWQQLLKGQPPHYCRIVELRAGGATFEEIAREMGMNERSVRRVIRQLASRLK